MSSLRILWQSKQVTLGVSSKYDRILVWTGRNKTPIAIPANIETLRELKKVIQPAIETYLRATAAHQLEVTMSQLSFNIDMINRTVTHNRTIPNPSIPSDREAAAMQDKLIKLLQSFTERHQG